MATDFGKGIDRIPEMMQNLFNLAMKRENELPEDFTIFAVREPLNAGRKLRTTSMVEFQNKELKKRIRF